LNVKRLSWLNFDQIGFRHLTFELDETLSNQPEQGISTAQRACTRRALSDNACKGRLDVGLAPLVASVDKLRERLFNFGARCTQTGRCRVRLSTTLIYLLPTDCTGSAQQFDALEAGF
jgi:hypothetical protein